MITLIYLLKENVKAVHNNHFLCIKACINLHIIQVFKTCKSKQEVYISHFVKQHEESVGTSTTNLKLYFSTNGRKNRQIGRKADQV